MALSPVFPEKIANAEVAFTTANTNLDGTGTIATLFTAPSTVGLAGAAGSIVESITVTATATTTAGWIAIYRHNGTTFFLIRVIPVTAVTVGAGVAPWRIPQSEGADINGRLMMNLKLEPGDSIRVSTRIGEPFIATADIGLIA